MSSQVDAASRRSTSKVAMIMTSEQATAGRTVPIIQTAGQSAVSAPDDPMEVTSTTVPSQPPAPTMGPPPSRTSPDAGTNGSNKSNEQAGGDQNQSQSGNMYPAPAPTSSGTASGGSGQQPKVQQTAFIHKLYNMLDDASISHLITWSPSEESFLMSPSNDFSKVLAQYFKHTNISSFVRQLNMYGFHKVSDVFHTGSPDAQLWEFKHGNGSFRRGDLAGLRDIRRRASKQALVHRDSYPSAKPPPPPYSHPGTPAEMAHPPMDTDGRLAQLETAMYDAQHRIARHEEANQALHHKNHVLVEALARSLQLTSELSRIVLSSAANQDSVYGRITDMQQEIQRQTDLVRNIDEPFEPSFTGFRPYFSTLSLDGSSGAPPISPRQYAQDDQRRQALGSQRSGGFRPTVPSHLSITPRRYGSIGAQGGINTSTTSPSSLRYQVNAPSPEGPRPPLNLGSLAPPMGPNLARRHTSADIRIQPWPNGAHASQYGNEGQPSQPQRQWPPQPPSPTRLAPQDAEGNRIRESFSNYSFGSAKMSQPTISSRPSTPPYGGSGGNTSAPQWNWGGSNSRESDKYAGGASLGSNLAGGFGAQQHSIHPLYKDSQLNSGPPTRRGSMAHILNPEETRERDEEGVEREEDDRKRKRLG